MFPLNFTSKGKAGEDRNNNQPTSDNNPFPVPPSTSALTNPTYNHHPQVSQNNNLPTLPMVLPSNNVPLENLNNNFIPPQTTYSSMYLPYPNPPAFLPSHASQLPSFPNLHPPNCVCVTCKNTSTNFMSPVFPNLSVTQQHPSFFSSLSNMFSTFSNMPTQRIQLHSSQLPLHMAPPIQQGYHQSQGVQQQRVLEHPRASSFSSIPDSNTNFDNDLKRQRYREE